MKRSSVFAVLGVTLDGFAVVAVWYLMSYQGQQGSFGGMMGGYFGRAGGMMGGYGMMGAWNGTSSMYEHMQDMRGCMQQYWNSTAP